MVRRDRATPIKEEVHELGRHLGFSTAEEIDETFLSITLDDSYTPRVDVVWYLDLQRLGLDTARIADHFDFDVDDRYRRFPLVAFEIEASDPTTKTMEADLANLETIGTPFSILIVDEQREDGLYRRGKRILRTFREMYGHTNCICLDRSQISKLLDQDWDIFIDQPDHDHEHSGGTGGEGDWTTNTRQQLAEIGREIGFVVKEDWIPDDLRQMYNRQQSLWNEAADTTEYEQYTWEPDGERKPFRGWRTYYTGSKIDLMWTTPYPKPMQKLLSVIVELDTDFETHTPLIRTRESLHPFVGFEIESSAGKHAAGGVLNLGTYPTIGQIVVPSESEQRQIERKIETYNRSLGLRNVETIVWNHG